MGEAEGTFACLYFQAALISGAYEHVGCYGNRLQSG